MNRKLQSLCAKWVSSHRAVDLLELRDVIRREKRNAERRIIKVSPALLREIRGELAYVSHQINIGACFRETYS